MSAPEYLTFTVEGKEDGDWTVSIYNPNTYAVEVTYNEKMCFKSDAQDYDGCTDLVDINIPAESEESVSISTNALAGYITARINYWYHGFAYSAVTYANNLKTSSSSASEYNTDIRHL